MLVISNNCCGGRLYQQTNTKFNNPFIWMVSPYDSIYYTMMNFKNVNWKDIDFKKSKLRPNTFIINVQNNIDFHYVHYKFDEKANTIVQEKKFDIEEHWTGDVFYNKIWEFVLKKYQERTKRMLELNEDPCFLICQENYANINQKHTLKDIANCESKYKRIIITTDESINRNDEVCKTIIVPKIKFPEPTVKEFLPIIKDFFKI